ncbi:MAG: hypothetical protein ACOYLQ_04295 [Hyphomicrobiaceae bacterium]
MRCGLIAVGFIGLLAIPAAAQEELSGEALKAAVSGRTVHLDTPVGTLPIVYASNGLLVGRGGGLGHYLGASEDKGRWWISGAQLCQRWTVWLDAVTHCYKFRRSGDRVHWQRGDGRTGTARIGAQATGG